MKTKLTLAILAVLMTITGAYAQSSSPSSQTNTTPVVLTKTSDAPGTANGRVPLNPNEMSQYVVSARAGGVNAADGDVSFKRGDDDWKLVLVGDQMTSGDRIKTGADSRAEILLSPGSYLRLAANTEVKLDNTSLVELKVSLIQGSVLIEAAAFDDTDRKLATIALPKTQVSIDHTGVYRFNVDSTGETIEVEKGKLSVNGAEIGSGKVADVDNSGSSPKVQRVDKSGDSFDKWSEDRAKSLVAANDTLQSPTAIAPSPFSGQYGSGYNPLMFGFYDSWFAGASPWGQGCGGSWFFNPFFGGFTYLPGMFNAGFFSPCWGGWSGYGYPYRTLGYYRRPGFPWQKPTLSKVVTHRAGTITAKSGAISRSMAAAHGGHSSSGFSGGGHSSGGGGGHSGGGASGGGGGGHR